MKIECSKLEWMEFEQIIRHIGNTETIYQDPNFWCVLDLPNNEIIFKIDGTFND